MSSKAWGVSACSTLGGCHQIAKYTHNQDYVIAQHFGEGFILAVADGHGSKQYDRSEEGARIACEVARTTMIEWMAGDAEARQVPVLIHNRWQAAVRMRDIEHQHNGRDTSPGYSRYGTTLLCLGYDGYGNGFAIQIGDGAMAVETEHGPVMPFGWVQKVSSTTYSLSADDAYRRIKVATFFAPVKFAVLVTDGISDMYESEEEFVKNWVLDPQEVMKTKNWNGLVRAMSKATFDAAWIDGDDSTVAYAVRKEAK